MLKVVENSDLVENVPCSTMSCNCRRIVNKLKVKVAIFSPSFEIMLPLAHQLRCMSRCERPDDLDLRNPSLKIVIQVIAANFELLTAFVLSWRRDVGIVMDLLNV